MMHSKRIRTRSKKSFRKYRNSSIKNKIQCSTVLLISVLMTVFGALSLVLIYNSTMQTLRQNMKETAVIAADRVEKELNDYVHIAYETGCMERLSNAKVLIDEKEDILNTTIQNYDIVECAIIGTDGYHISTGVDYSERDFFKAAMKGETYLSDPVVDTMTNEVHITISAPLWKGGKAGSDIEGVIMITPKSNLLNDIVKSIHISKNSDTFIINGFGVYTAAEQEDKVVSQENLTDSTNHKLAGIAKNMAAGEQGFDSYYSGLKKYMIAYAPIGSTNGWSLAIKAPTSDFMTFTNIGMVVILFVLLIGIMISVNKSHKLAEEISQPIGLCTKRLKQLAEGDLKSDVPVIATEDETKILSLATDQIVLKMNQMISDISDLLTHMSQGNFNVESQARDSYIGDFTQILLAIDQINESLSSTLTTIHTTTEQVSAASAQMSDAAQDLATGATKQTQGVEGLTEQANELKHQVIHNAESSGSMKAEVTDIVTEAKTGSNQMNEMTEAMKRISDNSNKIKNVIGAIESIAAQTNLLSLNASIEAARAGDAGRGFAVVANQIRILAEQSASAVIETRDLIEAALTQIDAGNTAVERTVSTFSTVIEQLQHVLVTVAKVTQACDIQADKMIQMKAEIEQITAIIETNSAMAQESLATSQELSAQAVCLNGLVGQFKLKTSKQ